MANGPKQGPTWRLTEAQNEYHGCTNFTTLRSGALPPAAGAVDAWQTLRLSFSGGTVDAIIGGTAVASGVSVLQPAGVAGFGSGWNVAQFSNLSVAAHPSHPPQPGSFIFDVLPSIVTCSNFSGAAGLILDLSGGKYPLSAPSLVVRETMMVMCVRLGRGDL